MIENRVLSLPPQDLDTSMFKMKYDKTQRQLQSLAAMDDLLSGMLCQVTIGSVKGSN